jgi:hypothetical protein
MIRELVSTITVHARFSSAQYSVRPWLRTVSSESGCIEQMSYVKDRDSDSTDTDADIDTDTVTDTY